MPRTVNRVARLGAAIAFALCCGAASAGAEEGAFYANKKITLYVGTTAGGGYDLYARTLAQFMPSHIPGHPTIIVQNRPGSSGLGLANSVYNAVPKDGTVIAISPVSMILSEVLDPKSLSYKSEKFGWVGTMSTMTDVMAVLESAGVETLEDAKQKQVVIGAGNKFGNPGIYPAITNVLLGTKFKIVLGYAGSSQIYIAMERNELQGRTNQWNSWKTQRPQWVKEGKLKFLFQVGPKVPALKDVPTLTELVPARYKPMMDLLEVGELMGRSMYAPPGLPAERLATLRTAFDATMSDPAYLAQMKKLGLNALSRKGVQLQADIGRAMTNTAAAAEQLRTIVNRQYK